MFLNKNSGKYFICIFWTFAVLTMIVSCSANEAPNTVNKKPVPAEPGDEKPEPVKIGNQEWSAKNLSVVHFKNGEEIPQAKSAEDWVKACNDKKPAWCYYDFKFTDEYAPFGRLYNWYAVNDSRGLAPEGWHIPSEAEWYDLISFAGQEEYAGRYLKSKDLWFGDGNGVDEYGFRALPAGLCECNGNCDLWLGMANFWTSAAKNDSTAVAVSMMGVSYDVELGRDAAFSECMVTGEPNGAGFSVRCIKD